MSERLGKKIIETTKQEGGGYVTTIMLGNGVYEGFKKPTRLGAVVSAGVSLLTDRAPKIVSAEWKPSPHIADDEEQQTE